MNTIVINKKEWTVKIAEVLFEEIGLNEVLSYLQSVANVILDMNSNQDYMLVDETKTKTYIVRKNEKDLELCVLSIMDAKHILKR